LPTKTRERKVGKRRKRKEIDLNSPYSNFPYSSITRLFFSLREEKKKGPRRATIICKRGEGGEKKKIMKDFFRTGGEGGGGEGEGRTERALRPFPLPLYH